MTNKAKANSVENARPDQRGFSLIELLITVAIILIIAAIAIPSFLHSKIVANEAAAAQNLRNLVTASGLYNSTWGNGYPPDLSSLGSNGGVATCDQAALIDTMLSTAPYQKGGYVYGYTGQDGTVQSPPGCGNAGFWGYMVTATPMTEGLTGNRSFCSDEQGVIHYDITGATAASDDACSVLPALSQASD